MSSDEEQTRDEIEEIVNDEPPVQEPVQEAVRNRNGFRRRSKTS